MAMDKELEIVCKTALDGQHVLNVPAPLDGLTLAAATAAANTIVAKNVFSTKTGDLTGIAEIRIRTTEVNSLA